MLDLVLEDRLATMSDQTRFPFLVDALSTEDRPPLRVVRNRPTERTPRLIVQAPFWFEAAREARAGIERKPKTRAYRRVLELAELRREPPTPEYERLAWREVKDLVLRRSNGGVKNRKSDIPRAKTINFAKLGDRDRRGWTGELFDRAHRYEKPQTRGDCKDMPRPCPFLTCKYHLAIDVSEEKGNLKINFPHLLGNNLRQLEDQIENLELMEDTCALDVADRVGESGQFLEWEDVGAKMNVLTERVRQIAASGLQTMRAADIREDVLINIRLTGARKR